MPKKKVKQYIKIARIAAKVWRDYGALEYKECVGDDLDVGFGMPFPKGIRTRRGETVVFSWIVYKSKADRKRINAKVMKDPRIANMDPKAMPFDCSRMIYGGFKVAVSA